jgi:hypothetical protein
MMNRIHPGRRFRFDEETRLAHEISVYRTLGLSVAFVTIIVLERLNY